MAQSTKHFTHAGAHVLTEADDINATAPPPAEPEGFPLHAMRMKDFLALDKLRPHNALKKEGLVVARVHEQAQPADEVAHLARLARRCRRVSA